ncbi:hypothetical protein QEG98_24080 [Myxococcus sp. MxC21-1]|uniref:hypothetical protein n=1 Tax=Myxococcus sp. MxC21-1 TaxID=3041439 RepID=UPI00292E9C22|nr:hypothetical protein [Myxococcus sp. MxC21-1]WNZ59171.1 hypothetical protein QEG98_24080 [Myxococcus sp. MxC21-1]
MPTNKQPKRRQQSSRPPRADWRDLPGQYRIEFSSGASALGADEQDSIISVDGKVIYVSIEEEADAEIATGVLAGHVIQRGRMFDRGENVFDECDAKSQTLIDYVSAILDPSTHELKEEIDKQFGGIVFQNVLTIDVIESEPKHRGYNLGLAVASRLIETFGRGCGLVICKPFPLQFDINRKTDPSLSSFSKIQQPVARKKLQQYWGRLGFEPIKGTPYFGLNLDYRHPTRLDLGLE